MADVPTIEELARFFEENSAEKAKEALEKIAKSSEKARKAMNDFSSGLHLTSLASQQLETDFDGLKEKVKNLEIFSSAVSYFDKIGKSFSGMRSANLELAQMIKQVGDVALALRTGIKPDVFNIMGEAAQGASSDINKTLDNINKLSKISDLIPGFGKGAKVLLDVYSSFTMLGDAAKKFEFGLINLTGSSGELGSLLKDLGDDFSGLESKAVSFINLTTSIGNSVGLTSEQVARYAMSLGKIPGSLDMNVKLSKDGSEQIHLLEAAIKVATGSGQDFSSVIDQLNQSYRDFNTTGNKALENIARISSASQALKIPLDLVRDYTMNSAQAFRFFGDNSQAAVSILGRFGPALKESGLGPKAIADLTQNITRNIGEMNLAQRAFVSGTSGGPGGLMGGYQIEVLKQQGRLDQVEKMVEESLRKQFGGRIVTLQEAAKDASSAAQFTKQVQLLTQGPTKIAGSEAEAYRILEAMAKGQPAGVKEPVKAGEEALNQTIEVGNKIHERNFNQLVVLSNIAEREAHFGSITANNLTRLLSGTGGPMADLARRSMGVGSIEAAREIKMIPGGAPVAERNLAETNKNILSTLGSPVQAVKDLYSGFKSWVGMEFGKTKEQVKGSFLLPENPSPGRNVAGIMKEGAPKLPALLGPEQNQANININAVCPVCNKKTAEEVALKVVNGKLTQVKKNESLHVHTGADLGL